MHDPKQLPFLSVINRFDTANPHFLIYQCGWERTAPDKAPRRMSRTFALHYIVEGEVLLTEANQTSVLDAHTCFLLRPGRSVVYSPNPENPAAYYWFSITGSMAGAYFDSMGFSSDVTHFPLTSAIASAVHDGFRHTLMLAREKPPIAHIALYRGLYEVCEHIAIERSALCSPREIPLGLSPIMTKVLAAISDQYANPNFTLQMLAHQIGYNPSYLSRLFKREMGIPFTAYVSQKRMHEAAILMRQGEKKSGVIAEKVGIRTASYFTKLYKRANSDTQLDGADHESSDASAK